MTGRGTPDPLVARVAAALQAIPHTDDCSTQAFGYSKGPCDCDREQRIALAVADAIDLLTCALPSGGATSRDAAVAALGPRPDIQKETP